MISVEENNRQLNWWRERLEESKDWNSLPKETRRRLLNTFKQCMRDLINLDITDKELIKLVQYTDIPTVFDAVISVIALSDVEKKDRRAILAYLTRVILNSEKGRLNVEPMWHKESPRPKRRGKVVTSEYARQFDPYNFKENMTCKFCGTKIRSNNVTGVCTKCQHRGRNGRESEH